MPGGAPPGRGHASALWRSRRHGDFAGLGLISHPRRALIGLVRFRTAGRSVVVALITLALLVVPPVAARILALTVLLALLSRLVHCVQYPKVVFRVLKETLRGNPVATAGSVASKLQIFLKELLCRAADANLRPVAVEYMVSIEWGLHRPGGDARHRRRFLRHHRLSDGCGHAYVSYSFCCRRAFPL